MRNTTKVAVVGLACALPGGVNDPHAFWNLLDTENDVIERLPPWRWSWPSGVNPKTSHQGIDLAGFLRDVECFDPAFFRISPKEAANMDPQQRILLQLSWACFEDAGYPARAIAGTNTGVFIGASGSNYQLRLCEHSLDEIDGHFGLSTSMALLANRLSYFYDFNAPSIQVDTACSSSLVAVDQAVRSLNDGTCAQAFVAGINIICHPAISIAYYQAGMLAKDGKCKAFDEAADGYVRSEGAVALLLKPLESAIRDQDQIHAVIIGSATNHGGRAAGLTVPNPVKQADLIQQACSSAKVSAETINYIEAHGSGTPLGDPIEIRGLKEAFNRFSPGSADAMDEPYCGLGSVKTNIGHLEAASGIAGLLKVILCMKHKTLPRCLNFHRLNPQVSLSGSPFYVVDEKKPWNIPRGHSLRRAGVNSFGSGGANAHVLIEEYVPAAEPERVFVSAPHSVIVLSARNADRLRERVEQLLQAIESRALGGDDLADIAYTLQIGREAMEWRLACVVEDLPQLCVRLKAWLNGDKAVEDLYQGQARQHKEVLGLFAEGELREAISKWIERGKLGKLAELWARGLEFDWEQLYGAGRMPRPRRISLPTYPFAKERYWVGTVESGSANGTRLVETGMDLDAAPSLLASSSPPLPIGEAPALMLFEESWRACALEGAAAKAVDASAGVLELPAQTLVCFLSEPHHRQAIVQTLLELSPRSKFVFVSCANGHDASVEGSTTQEYEVSLDDPQTALGVLRDIKTRCSRVDGLLYLWPLEQQSLIQDPMAWVRLVQALAASGLGCQKLVLAGRALDEVAQAQLEAWIGAERSIGLVLPDTKIRVLIEAAFGSDAAPDMRTWARRLLGELQNVPQSVLYRDGVRHVCGVRELAATEPTFEPTLLRRGGTYLITGGCGGLGLIFAGHLARGYAANLVLTGRSALSDSIAQKIDELQALGAQAQYVQADVSDEAAMRVVIERAQQRFGVLNGVIHAAGVASVGSNILQKDAEAFARTLAPKVEGTLVLDRLLEDQPLDFLCYFSSSSAVLGDFGGCDYAIANRFLMAYARARRRRALRGEAQGKTLAIAWPLWEEGGMGIGTPQQTEFYLKSSGQRALATVQGIEVFERLLRGPATQPLVMLGEPTRLRRMFGLDNASSSRQAASRQAPPLLASPVAAGRGSGRCAEMKGFTLAQCLEWDLKEQIWLLLRVPRQQLDSEANLAEFGFDSIGLIAYAKRLSAQFAIDFTPALFFSHPSLAQLVEYLLGAFGPVLEDFYRDDVRASPAAKLQPASEVISRSVRSGSTAPVVAASPHAHEPIAIIGMSGRFPGARTVEDFWSILRESRDVVQEIPPQRFDWHRYHGDPIKEAGKTNGKWLGVLEGVDEFDPLFFELSPREAETMDPRQRLLLQEAWRALEDAGYGREQLETHAVGMFVGVEQGDYQYLVGASRERASLIANHDGILASRLAYLLDLRGPVMAINTTCSSGLVAAHQACQSLRMGECDTAIAAGVNLVLTPQSFIALAKAGMLSDDGKCHAFGREANGMVPGEAIVAVVLKRLSQAQADGDPILAVIQASGTNYDGKTSGITAPSGRAQSRLLKDVYRRHGIDPRTVEYVVAHGTGTRLGDPIEVNALCEVFSERTSDKGFCALTSTKGNVGHTFAASGLVSLVGLVQAMRHELIPPSLHCQQESDYVRWSDSPFYVNRQARAWPKRKQPRLGALSAFGMSGTNAHMVVASWDAEAAAVNTVPSWPCHLLVLSAKTAPALQERTRDMLQLLQSRTWTAQELQAIGYTLLVGRQHFAHRSAIVVQDVQNAIHAWQQASCMQKLPNLFEGQVPRGFRPQPVLLGYAQHLLEQTSTLLDDPERCREHLQALAELYCQGYELRWSLLFGKTQLDRIRLPTYPFARERYWVDACPSPAQKATGGVGAEQQPILHPLVQRNTSDLSEQRYSSWLSGEEFFLRDHVVAGHRVLPAAAQLELAREAVWRALGADGAEVQPDLENVVFARPVVVGSMGLELHIALRAAQDGAIEWEIYSDVVDGPAAQRQADGVELGEASGGKLRVMVHSRGRAVLRGGGLQSKPLQVDVARLCARGEQVFAPGNAGPDLDVSFVGAVSGSAAASAEGKTELYALFDRIGLSYGPAFRALGGVWSIREADGQVLALGELRLPRELEPTLGQYILHPSVLDGALQAFVGLEPVGAEAGEQARPEQLGLLVPFALDRLEVFAALPERGWALLRARAQVDREVRKLDVQIVDADGRMCARLSGFSSRPLRAGPSEEILQRKRASVYPLPSSADAPTPEGASIPPVVATGILHEKTRSYLTGLLAHSLKLPPERIDAQAPLEQYGIDSVMVMELTSVLERNFGALSKTLFFEYQSIEELTHYFVQNHSQRLSELIDLKPDHPPAPQLQTRPVSSMSIRGLRKHFAASVPRHLSTAVDIAIIGMSGRYPAANSVENYWQSLVQGLNCITEIPPERWDHAKYFDADKNKPGKSYSKWGGFIEGFDEFDPLFFNISPREAPYIDPQERVFLQCVWAMLEDAGYTRATLARGSGDLGLGGNVGVFVGVMYEEYQLYGAQAQALSAQGYALLGNPSSIANRVSFFCNLHGPSLALDTMCSSSLTAIHLAIQSLVSGGCEVAIAGGVNLSVHPNKYLVLAEGRFAASDGLCKSFGEGGDGYVPAEGVGAVLLKPLSKAVADEDRIYGVIKGSAINHGGKTNGYTVPNPKAQAQLIAQALKEAGVHPRTISYVEAHGTGTALGDPIEIAGLSQAFGAYTQDKQYCAIGSAKSNIGHCESAAGIAGLTKVLLQMKHRKLVKSLHSERLNPHIAFEQTPFVVQQDNAPWTRPRLDLGNGEREYPRIAGVSSFGAGGSNAHLIVEEYIAAEPVDEDISAPAGPSIVPLSARTEDRLKEQVRQLLTTLREAGSESNRERNQAPTQLRPGDAEGLNGSPRRERMRLSDVAYTLQVGREAMDWRLACVVQDPEQLCARLGEWLAGGKAIKDLYQGQVRQHKETLGPFLADEDMAQTIDAWIAKGKLGKLAALWTKGLAFDWSRLYSDGRLARPRRISLPTYPFAKERYWVDVPAPVSATERETGNIGAASGTSASGLPQEDAMETLLIRRQWTAAAQEAQEPALQEVPQAPGGHWVVLCDVPAKDAEQAIQARLPHARCVRLQRLGHAAGDLADGVLLDQMNDLAARYTTYAEQLLELVRKILASRPRQEVMVQLVVPSQGIEASVSGLLGLLKSAQQENPRLLWQQLSVEAEVEGAELARRIQREAALPGSEVRYLSGARREELRLERAAADDLQSGEVISRGPQWKAGGVYLITGGAGGLGLVFARWIARQAAGAKLVLVGRSAQTEQIQERLRELERLDAQACYLAVDIADREQVEALVAQIVATHGRLDGVIHSAGVLRDSLVLNKSAAKLREVFAPKVKGLVNLDAATRSLRLECFVVFSSISALLGNMGQADYAAANGFMDSYAQWRNEQVALGAAHGRTLSIGWPLWAEGGMQMPAAARERMWRDTGLAALPTQEGTQAFDQALALKAAQVIVLFGSGERIQQTLQRAPSVSMMVKDLPPGHLTSGRQVKHRHGDTPNDNERGASRRPRGTEQTRAGEFTPDKVGFLR
jgi:acyl transferase domain-containing protein/aryl carrier-like protein